MLAASMWACQHARCSSKRLLSQFAITLFLRHLHQRRLQVITLCTQPGTDSCSGPAELQAKVPCLDVAWLQG